MTGPSSSRAASGRDVTAELETAPLEEVWASLESTPEGLGSAEAQRRLAHDGPNAIAETRRRPILQFLAYYWGPIPWMIEAALVLAGAVGRWEDAGIIGVLLVMNGVVGFWEEYQAGNAIAALKERLASTARVLRDGTWCELEAARLVTGDVTRVRLGDVVPADARLFSGSELEVDQSALTGESLPVTHGAGDLVYSGTVVTVGEADAVVCATGLRTYFGRTAQLVEEAGTTSHFQQAVLRIAKYLIVMAVALVTLTLTVGVARGNAVATMLEFALVVVIASIPVALPAVLSVTMAVGAGQLAHREAVVSHLAAVEELGGVDVLCADKTGTLTQNRLAVGEPFTGVGVEAGEVIAAAAFTCRADDRDPIDLAILAAAPPPGGSTAQVVDFTPFDPVRKRSDALVADGHQRFEVTKGAPQVILELVDDPAVAGPAEHAIDQFAGSGSRALAVARRDDDAPWRLLGIVPLADPPREDSRATIEAARDLGVTVKMVTGDQVVIGREIAHEVGLGENILAADTLDEDQPEHQLVEVVEGADGFAQVFPEHKFRIVKLLQARGHLVGMTGDGVNDAPALKQADAGIAVQGATDAARAAADLVLLAPGLSVIIDAIRTSREIFQRMTSYAIYRIAETIRILLLVTIAIVVVNFFPVTPIMIVLLALLNDGAILTIAYDRVLAPREPAAWQMRTVLSIATVLGVVGVIASFTLFILADTVFHVDHATLQAMIYLKLSVAGHLTIFLTRTRGPFWSHRPAPILIAAVGITQLLATLIAVYGVFMTPIGWTRAAIIWGYAIVWFLVNDRVKLFAYRLLEREPAVTPAASTT